VKFRYSHTTVCEIAESSVRVILVLVHFEFFTPKVFANFSPGLSFGNPGDKDFFSRRAQPSQGCAIPSNDIRVPRVAKAQPWAEIGEHLRCRSTWNQYKKGQ